MLLDDFEVRPSAVDEALAPGPVADAVTRLALDKARAVASAVPDAVVVGADTVVVIDRDVYGKPGGAEEARVMLRRLSGRWHQVVTGLAVVAPGGTSTTAVVSRVLISRLTDAEIDAYVGSGEPLDKAGAYAIQGFGGRLVAGLVGSYTNVIGLPLEATRSLLGAAGVDLKPAVES